MSRSTLSRSLTLVAALVAMTIPALASSHREAPQITRLPKVDGTDFYAFNSYENGREGYVTLIANYLPLQDPYGGPNYFTLDPDAIYAIKVDNDGDAVADITFQFRFQNTARNIALEIGPPGATKRVAVPVINVGSITPGNDGALNVVETYTLDVVRGDTRTRDLQRAVSVTAAASGSSTFTKPVDNIGTKSLPDYEAYARQFIYQIDIPGCAGPGRLFVGQRKDPFVVNLGETFDLVNIANPIGPVDAESDSLDDKNVTSFVLEVPARCLISGSDPVIAAWTTASLSAERVAGLPGLANVRVRGQRSVQVSRLANPLVNELVIGLPDKDRFNASEPADDAQFATYVTHPTLPAILELLFGSAGVRAPTLFPRTDLVTAFLTGVDGVNKTSAVAEMMRLNTSTPPVSAAAQNNLGVIGGDLAGFPNGRRPGDDVVDIALRVVMGALLPADVAPSGSLPFTDGALVDATMFPEAFPYLNAPIPGSPEN